MANLGTVDPPPQKQTAASTGTEDGGKSIEKLASYSEVEFYSDCPILATHFGLVGGQ